MRKIITMVLFILLGILVYHTYNSLFITKVESDEIFIRRPDSIINYTDYSFQREGASYIIFEAVGKCHSLGTSIRIFKAGKWIFSIQYDHWQKGTVLSVHYSYLSEGIVDIYKNGVNYPNQPYEKYRAHFEEAEKILQETRARFEPIIEKELIRTKKEK